MEWGGEMVRGEEGREITVGLICELHQRLMDGVRGGDKTPGRLRERQVLIGGNGSYESAEFVPPSALHLRELLEDLCLFVREAREIPPLVRTAMAHYQFETIHPFNDGNGRVGRLLIGLEIVRDFGLPSPALHMSPYFEADRRAYYDGLLAVSQRGALADWTEYFLKGVVTQAEDAIARMGALRRLRREYRGKFEGKQSPEKTLRVIDQLFKNPAVTVRTVADGLQTSPKTAEAHIKRLIEAGLLVEVTGRNYGRVFIAREIVRVARESVKEPG
jgi:Fic family protein